jgi:hypothetical protein
VTRTAALFNQAALLSTKEEIRNEVGIQHAPARRRIPGMVGEQRRRNSSYGHSFGLHRIDGSANADVAGDHLALD